MMVTQRKMRTIIIIIKNKKHELAFCHLVKCLNIMIIPVDAFKTSLVSSEMECPTIIIKNS